MKFKEGDKVYVTGSQDGREFNREPGTVIGVEKEGIPCIRFENHPRYRKFTWYCKAELVTPQVNASILKENLTRSVSIRENGCLIFLTRKCNSKCLAIFNKKHLEIVKENVEGIKEVEYLERFKENITKYKAKL